MSIVFICVLIGCASNARRPPLAPAIAFNEPQRFTQSVVISRSGQDYRLLCILELGRRGLVLAAFTELGQRLFTIVYTPSGLSIDRSPTLPASFDPQSVLADLQLVYWPLNILQNSLTDGWSVIEPESTGERALMHRGDVVAAVHRDAGGAIEIQRPLLGYRMTIDAVSN